MKRIALGAALALAANFTVAAALAEGTMVEALPSDVAKLGVSSGFAVNFATQKEAEADAMRRCREGKASKTVLSMCKVVARFRDQCAATAFDPRPGTPGWGWAVADTKREAQKTALDRCEATAGRGREAACVVDKTLCDGKAE